MQWAYTQVGIDIPRVTTTSSTSASTSSASTLEPGDLVFFQDSSGYIHHVGMYIGGDKFLHAPHTGDVVKISSLDEPYYASSSPAAGGMDASAPAGAVPPPAPPPSAAPRRRPSGPPAHPPRAPSAPTR